MKKYTWEELEKMDVVELVNLAESYGLSARSVKTFTWKQIVAYVHGEQLFNN